MSSNNNNSKILQSLKNLCGTPILESKKKINIHNDCEFLYKKGIISDYTWYIPDSLGNGSDSSCAIITLTNKGCRWFRKNNIQRSDVCKEKIVFLHDEIENMGDVDCEDYKSCNKIDKLQLMLPK
jgi:hypothetical protein